MAITKIYLPLPYGYMKEDNDNGKYFGSAVMSFDNGKLTVFNHINTKMDVFDGKSKRTYDIPESETFSFENHKIVEQFGGFIVYDLDNNQVYEYKQDLRLDYYLPLKNGLVFGKNNECIYYNLINNSIATIETSSDVNFNCFQDEDDTLYVELYDDDSMISTVNKYNLSTLDKTDVYTFDFNGFSKGKEYDVMGKCGNYLFYRFGTVNPQYYRCDMSTGKVEFVECSKNIKNFTTNGDQIFYSTLGGIYQLNPDTLESYLVSEEQTDKILMCTKNYIYAYDHHSFGTDSVLPDVELGYTVKQIPIKTSDGSIS